MQPLVGLLTRSAVVLEELELKMDRRALAKQSCNVPLTRKAGLGNRSKKLRSRKQKNTR